MAITSKASSDSKELTIRIQGRFDFSALQVFKDAYENQDTIYPSYVIDLQETDYLDSSALGMLLALREYAGGDNAKIIIKDANQDIKKILHITKLDELFTID